MDEKTKQTFDLMKRFIKNRAAHVRVQTELGTAVKITKVEAVKLIEMLETRGVLPCLDCTEIRTMVYLVVISNGPGGVYLDN